MAKGSNKFIMTDYRINFTDTVNKLKELRETYLSSFATDKKLIEKEPNKSHLLTACPAFVNYIENTNHRWLKTWFRLIRP